MSKSFLVVLGLGSRIGHLVRENIGNLIVISDFFQSVSNLTIRLLAVTNYLHVDSPNGLARRLNS